MQETPEMLIPGLGKSPGGGNGNALLYSCLENPVGRGTWWAPVHRVTKSQTQLSTNTSVVEFVHNSLGTRKDSVHVQLLLPETLRPSIHYRCILKTNPKAEKFNKI